MKRKIITFIILIITLNCFSQKPEKIYYNEIVDNCLENTNKQIKQAWKDKKNEKAKSLFDSLVNNCLKGKYLSNYNFQKLDKKILSTNKIDKPILLVTSATWCGPCWGEIPTLNKLIEKYENQFEIIVLFWNKKKDLRKMASKYDKRIHLIPADKEQIDKSSISISGFNHKLDYPGVYLIDTDKKILDFTRGAAYPTKTRGWKEVNEINEKKLTEFLNPILK